MSTFNIRLVGRRLYFFLTGLGWALLLSGILLVSQSGTLAAVESSIPLTEVSGAPVPDFNQITFGNLPVLQGSGGFTAPPEMYVNGYDPSFDWSEGDYVVDVVSIGAFSEIMELDLDTISQLSNLNLSSVKLDEFFPMTVQTLGSLVEAIPSLEAFPIDQVPPIETLLTEMVGGFNPSQTIGQLLSSSPHLKDLAFADAPDSLQFSINDIPNLDITPLQDIKGAAESNIAGIPGLGDVPLAQLFSSLANPVGEVGILDIVFSPAEGGPERPLDRPISGSSAQPNVYCQEGCAHIELASVDRSSPIRGRQWESGKYQMMEGSGFGVLKNALSYDGVPGMEPVGRHLFGDKFKVVLWDTDETQGSASFALFFRICKRGFPDLGCTAYAIGPLPIFTQYETGSLFLGEVILGENSGPSTMTSAAKSWLASYRSGSLEQTALNSESERSTNPNSFTGSSNSSTLSNNPLANRLYREIDTQRLAQAFTQTDGTNYRTVGASTCDTQNTCSRRLGLVSSSDPSVRETITAKPGGAEFLRDVDSGKEVTSARLLAYLPQSEQLELRDSEIRSLIDVVSKQIDPTTNRPYGEGSPEKAIARVAEVYCGGPGAMVGSELLESCRSQVLQAY